MNIHLAILEIAVVLLGLSVLLIDLWLPASRKRAVGYAAAAGLGAILIGSFFLESAEPQHAFYRMYVLDGMALFFKRFFLVAGIIVLIMSVEFAERIRTGLVEFYALTLLALAGMMFAASANDFIMLFVSLELITVSFYVLTSFQRARVSSLEAGVKYLILGALSTAFTVYGIALIFGTAQTTNFDQVFAGNAAFAASTVFQLGLLLVLVGLGFKIAAFPFQIWAPDVYQGSPAPTTAFLAVGSKAAGFVLLLRVLFSAAPQVTAEWTQLLMVISAASILYGNLCAIPQRNLKRLLGYSSIAHAGYMLLGVTAMNLAGSSAILYYLAGYLFTVLAAFLVISVVLGEVQGDDISSVSGLHQRSPLLAASLAMAMVSLAGIPPLAGFFGKFLLIKALLEQGALQPAYYWLIGIAIVGVVISFYYYLGVVRAVYWSQSTPAMDHAVASPTRWALYACITGMLFLGIYPNPMLNATNRAVSALNFAASPPTQMGGVVATPTMEPALAGLKIAESDLLPKILEVQE
jgi:NADH-quinone oxidoreductase subunit N